MPPLKVLIIGGGIAGPALAHWLCKINAHITLIERSPTMRQSGQQVDIRAQGVAVMKKMGIEAAVRAASVPESGAQLVDLKGRTKAFFPAAQHGSGKQSFTSEFEIMRGDLVRILYGLTDSQPNVKRLFNTTIDSFTQDDVNQPDGKVHVRFRNGDSESYDLVVGADGTNSRIRKLMLNDTDTPDPLHHLGGHIAFFSVPANPSDSDRFTFCFLPASRDRRHVSRIVMTRRDHDPHLTRVYMSMRGRDTALEAAHRSGKLADLKTAWADLYQDGGWECSRFTAALRSAPEADDLYSTPFQEVRLPAGKWSKGRVVLLGDAAWSETANGFGTTWALVGAYVLAGEIASRICVQGQEKQQQQHQPDFTTTTTPITATTSTTTAAILQATHSYESLFRPIATAMQSGGKSSSQIIESLITPRSRLGIWCLHSVAKVAARLKLDQGAGLDGKIGRWRVGEYGVLEG